MTASRAYSASGTSPSAFSLDRLHWTGSSAFNTLQLVEVQRHMRAFDRHTTFGVPDPGHFGGFDQSEIRLGSIWLSRTAIHSPEGYNLEFRPRGEYCLNMPQRGRGSLSSGGHRVNLVAGQASLVAPGHIVRKAWQGPSDVLTVHIPSHLMLEMGADRVLGVAPIALVEEASCAALLRLLSGVCGALEEGDALADAEVSQHIERAIVALTVQSLATRPDAAGVAQVSGAVPYYVRRAERFMRANFRPGVTLDEMAEAAGVSRRTLQYGFRRYHQTTPMHFFRQIRLSYARAQLVSGNDVALIQLAWEAGYQNSSHFGSDYRAFFGEPPSQTQARARGLADTPQCSLSSHALQ